MIGFRTEPNGYSLSDTRRCLFIDIRTLQFLISQRLLEIRRMRHSVTRITRNYVTVESLDEFVDRYLTAGMYARERGLTDQIAARILRDNGPKPITTQPGIRLIYPR